MNITCLVRRTTIAAGLLCLASVFFTATAARADDEWGDLSGQFILDGDIPAIEQLENTKQEFCAKQIPSDELLVSTSNKGIADIFVYIPAIKKPKVHPALEKSKDKEVVLDQKGCRFLPHTLLARTDQILLIKSMDEFNHNTRTIAIKNTPVNFSVAANERKGLPVKLILPEKLPTQVKCDIHAWMSAYCLVLDHPYAAVSDAEGKFKIEKLPVGELDFTYWHSKPGFVEKSVKIKIKK